MKRLPTVVFSIAAAVAGLVALTGCPAKTEVRPFPVERTVPENDPEDNTDRSSAEVPSRIETSDATPSEALSGKELGSLKLLAISGRAGDEGWDILAGAGQLKVVKLDNSDVGDRTLEDLAKIATLEELTLTATKVSDSGVVFLAALPKLKKLRLSRTAVTDEVGKVLAKMPSLEEIDLSETGVGDDFVAALGNLPNLKRLNLYKTRVSDASGPVLAEMSGLTWLNLDADPVGDAVVVHLIPLKQLEWLHLGRTDLSDDGLHELAKVETLRTVHVTKTRVSRAGVENLQTQLPECRIIDDVRETSENP